MNTQCGNFNLNRQHVEFQKLIAAGLTYLKLPFEHWQPEEQGQRSDGRADRDSEWPPWPSESLSGSASFKFESLPVRPAPGEYRRSLAATVPARAALVKLRTTASGT